MRAERLTTHLMATLIALGCFLATADPARAQALVVNVDVGDGSGAYSGQGALADPGNDYWNEIFTSGSDLLASDGTTVTDISLTLTSVTGFSYANANSLLNDYQYVTTFDATYTGDIEFAGLQPDTSYLVYVYSAGDLEGQAGLIELNGVSNATSGEPSEQFLEGDNYVAMEVVSDASGVISGTYRPFDSFSTAAINGFQITPGTLPTRVLTIQGAESPTVHSPGDTIAVTVAFSDPVVLSQAGGLQLQLDIEGELIDAVHVGDQAGTSLTFEASAPSTTTFQAKVVADSLSLIGDAMLTDPDKLPVELSHEVAHLANDQISTQGLAVYPPVPGLDPSPHYSFRVRELGGAWQSPFAWFTRCVDDTPDAPDGYYEDFIGGWSHSYANFEMANNVLLEVEITRLDPVTGEQIDITSAVPHPRRKVRSWRVQGGRAYVRIDQPVLLAVDIDGQLDDNPTPSPEFINDTAIHAVSIFANPFILDKPDMNATDVLAVEPGTIPPDDGEWTTLYFKPGVHQLFDDQWEIGEDFRLRSNKRYYIPGDALVHGNMNNRDDDNDSRNIRIFGHGTLSGERIPHFAEQGLPGGEENPDAWRNRAIRVANTARATRVEGITVADPANHSIALVGGYNVAPEDFNYIRWAKVISWRANGDGVSPNGSGYVEDCFLRTQDDGAYVRGYGIRRLVFWSDVNGMPLRCSNMLNDNPAPYRLLGKLFVEDIDVIYARTGFGEGPGRSIIGFPDPATAFPDNDGSYVHFRDIRVEDRFATRTLFGWDLGSGEGGTRGVSGVRFENVRAAARNVDGELDPFLGTEAAPIAGLIFDDVILAGEHYDALEDFLTNEFVSDFTFEDTAPQEMTYRNLSGFGKWSINDDWDSAVEPANNDIVNHTAEGGALIVDATAYAGTLNVTHPSRAIVSIENGGRLVVADRIALGASGPGQLRLIDGELILLEDQPDAITVSTGNLYLERGTLEWTGDHIADLRTLFQAGAIRFNRGGTTSPVAGGVPIGRLGTNLLLAAFDPATGTTTAWVRRRALPAGTRGD